MWIDEMITQSLTVQFAECVIEGMNANPEIVELVSVSMRGKTSGFDRLAAVAFEQAAELTKEAMKLMGGGTSSTTNSFFRPRRQHRRRL